MPILFGATMLLNDTPAAKPFLVTLTFLTLLFAFAGMLTIKKLEEMDAQNIIQVFNQQTSSDAEEKIAKELSKAYKFCDKDMNQVLETRKNKSTTLPMSADEEIKKHLMPKFLKIFGDFNWNKGYNYKNWKQIPLFLK